MFTKMAILSVVAALALVGCGTTKVIVIPIPNGGTTTAIVPNGSTANSVTPYVRESPDQIQQKQ